ncbi:MAG: aldo/keto reductase [Sulfuricurvum sp. PC08-66]|nr:MAG: aldo/keto reductase [Sulfuricurvum sp. PC08-66]
MRGATKEGTFAYLKQFGTYSKDFYRFDGRFFFSGLGLGTYRKEPYREENYIVNYKNAVKMALLNGINHIDTAINYRYQISEREIGEALQELIAEGKIKRENIIIASKAGFVPLDFPFPPNPYAWIEQHILDAGRATREEVVIDQHCIAPQFLRWSVEQSLRNLGIDKLDICYLHNVETQLGYVDYATLLGRVRAAFEVFEALVEEGKIAYYGIASWNAFLYEEGHTEYVSLGDIVAIAREVGGEHHHFAYIQSPYNMVKTEAYTYPNQKGPDGRYYTLMQAVQGYGLSLVASSSLLQMNLFKGIFAPNIGEALGTATLSDVASALQFARSGNVVSALFGAVDTQHVEDNLLVAYLPNPTREAYQSLFGGDNAL